MNLNTPSILHHRVRLGPTERGIGRKNRDVSADSDLAAGQKISGLSFTAFGHFVSEEINYMQDAHTQ